MKKIALLILIVAMVGSWALAQSGTVTGNINYVPTTDVMGAHENGGRGCAGCHAPHSGGRGSGGVILGTGASATPYGVAEGDNALWGTDTNAIVNAGTLTFYGKYTVNLAGTSWASGALYTGVATCLSCHDGNVSRGAMMSGISYEQAWGLLNFAGAGLRNTTTGTTGNPTAPYYNYNNGTNPYPNTFPFVQNTAAAQPGLYGPNPIPTLLGSDGGVPGDYNNDHPVGPLANLGTVLGAWIGNLTFPASVKNGKNPNTIAAIGGTPFANFTYTYGLAALNATVSDGSGINGNFYVVCTTCHDQHVQNVYNPSTGYPSGWAGCTTGPCTTLVSAAKIFYTKGPYNPAAPYDPTHEPSTMRFCQQCHFDMSSESYGATNIGTAF